MKITGLTSLLFVVFAAAGCEDPFEFDWDARPDTARIYSLALPETNLPSAFSFFLRIPIVVESPGSTGQWDIALDNEGGGLVLLPPRALGINSRARIAPLPGVSFSDVLEAPPDTAAYVSDRGVPLTAGTVYVVQTGEQVGAFGSRCVYFAKLQPVEIDVAGGAFSFLFDGNPICNDPRLVPPDDD